MRATTGSALEHLSEMVRGIDVAMLATVDRAGRLHSRPMMALRAPHDGALWFFAAASSQLVDDVHGHHPVNLSYVDSQRGIYVSVSGRARVVRDPAKKEELWEKRLTAWLEGGAQDSSVVLLRIEVQEAEYWSAAGGREFTISAELGSATGGVRHEKVSFT